MRKKKEHLSMKRRNYISRKYESVVASGEAKPLLKRLQRVCNGSLGGVPLSPQVGVSE